MGLDLGTALIMVLRWLGGLAAAVTLVVLVALAGDRTSARLRGLALRRDERKPGHSGRFT